VTDAPINTELVDRLAERLAEVLEPRLIAAVEHAVSTDATTRRLVDAATVAQALNISRPTVYAMADQLGAIRVGDGDRPRLRFDLERAHERIGQRDGHAKAAPPKQRPTRSSPRSNAPLLPIQRRAA
jgi:hypothetical protein